MSKAFNTTACFLLLLCSVTANAQQATMAAGGDASGNGGTVSYSVGQVVYTTISGSGGKVSQGVQQAYEIYSVGIEDWVAGIAFSVFPNPTTDQVTLEVAGSHPLPMAYRLTDTHGRLVGSETITTSQTLIDMRTCAEATYFLTVTVADRQVQTFKIVKN